MHRFGLLTCVLVVGLHGVAHANQVDGTVPVPPPPPAPAAVSAPPTDVPEQVLPPPPPPPPAATADTAPPPNYAQAPAPGGPAQMSLLPPGSPRSLVGVETHDGFFLRLAVGFGGAVWSEPTDPGSAAGDDLKISGPSAGIDIAIGAVVVDSLAIHATLFGMGVSNPDVTVGGMSLGTAENSALTGSAIGVGLTYYVMPLNLYLSASVGSASAVFTFNEGMPDEVKIETDSGYGIDLILGKEWWVSDQWGLGIAAQLVHINVKDVDRRLTGSGFHLMFSATYN